MSTKTDLVAMRVLIDERAKTTEDMRKDQREALNRLEDAMKARLDTLNNFKKEITEERADFAKREWVEAKMEALDKALGESVLDRSSIHARLEALAALENQVATNITEIATARTHNHDIANRVQLLEAKPPQFSKPDQEEIERLLKLARKFAMEDGFTPTEMDVLHDVVKVRQKVAARGARRTTTLENVLMGTLGTIIIIVVSQILLHVYG